MTITMESFKEQIVDVKQQMAPGRMALQVTGQCHGSDASLLAISGVLDKSVAYLACAATYTMQLAGVADVTFASFDLDYDLDDDGLQRIKFGVQELEVRAEGCGILLARAELGMPLAYEWMPYTLEGTAIEWLPAPELGVHIDSWLLDKWYTTTLTQAAADHTDLMVKLREHADGLVDHAMPEPLAQTVTASAAFGSCLTSLQHQGFLTIVR